MAAPDIKKMVINRLPYLVDNGATQGLIADYQIEYFYELQGPFGVADAGVELEASYSFRQKSLVADLVAIAMIGRRQVENTEGVNGAAATGSKILTEATSGSSTAKWAPVKASDGARVAASGADIMARLKADAMRKATQMGFILDINEAGGIVIMSLGSTGNNDIISASWT